MNKKDKKLNSLQPLFDDDPTDQLPTLTQRAAGIEMPDAELEEFDEDTGETPILKLPEDPLLQLQDIPAEADRVAPPTRAVHRLEDEVQRLQANWLDIEDDLRARDASIEELRIELLNRTGALDALDTELQTATTDRQALEAEIEDLNSRVREQINQLDEKNAAFAASESAGKASSTELSTLREQLEAVQADCDRLGAETRSREIRNAERDQHTRQLHAENRRLCVVLQDLTGYIDGRRSRWMQQTAELKALQQTIASAEQLNIQIEREKSASENLSVQLQDRETRILTLEERIAEQALNIETAGQATDFAEARLTEANDQLSAYELELAEQQEKIGEQNASLQEAGAELAKMQHDQEELQQALSGKTTENSEIQQRLADMETENRDLRSNLEKQEALVGSLESEIRSKLDTLSVIGRHATLLPKLEERIVHGTPSNDSDHGKVTRLILALSEDRTVKFPLYKREMIIGRGNDSDIQIPRQCVSRQHARIVSDESGCLIEDLGSKNGVVVDAERVHSQKLRNGDIINIGQFELKFIDLTDQQSANFSNH
jgi:chromosome segregation ATPase